MDRKRFLECVEARKEMDERALEIADLMHESDPDYYVNWYGNREVASLTYYPNNDGLLMIDITSPIFYERCGDSSYHSADFPETWMHTDNNTIKSALKVEADARAEKKAAQKLAEEEKRRIVNEKYDRDEYERLKNKYESK